MHAGGSTNDQDKKERSVPIEMHYSREVLMEKCHVLFLKAQPRQGGERGEAGKGRGRVEAGRREK